MTACHASERKAGWTYTVDGTPVAFLMPNDQPREAHLFACTEWWDALLLAVLLAKENGCEFVGGPGK